MSYRTEARHEIGRFDKTNVTLTTEVFSDKHAATYLDGTATMVIRTGACWVQTNPTADECRALARSLLAAACDLDRIAHEQAHPVGEAA